MSFQGATAFREEDLRAIVGAALAALPQGATPEAARNAASDALRRAYHTLGYVDVSVVGTVLDSGLEFTVQEGRRWTLDGLDVQGNTVFTREHLLDLWRAAAGAPDAAPFVAGDAFDVERLNRWAAQVQAHYVDAGWLDAHLARPDVERDDARGSVRVTLHIAHEGPRYTIAAVEVPDALRALLGDAFPEPPVGEPCTRARTEGWAQAVVRALRRQGHPEPELRIGATRDAEHGEVTLSLTVEPGPARTVAEVRVLGNRRVPATLVRDKLGLREGERFDGDVERRGVQTLSATGEFREIDITYDLMPDDRMRVDVEVAETTGLVLKGSPYFHPWRRLGYNLLVEARDVLGDRHDLLGHVHVGHRGYHFGARYLRSGIFDEATTLTIGGDFFANERPAFTDRGAGGVVELRRYFSPGLSVALSYAALAHFDTTFDARTTTDVGRNYTEGRVSLLFDFDRTDNRLVPTHGERLFARVDHVDEDLGADVEFTRLRVGGGLWLPLSEDVRCSVEIRAGWLWPGHGSAGVPVPERFFLGGYESARSFRESRLGPRDATGALRGGEFENLLRTELVFAVVEPLDVALFADAGNVGSDVADYDLDDLRYALGVALRLVSRQTGPVVLSAAFNPDREPGEDEWVVDFAAGVIF